MGRVDAAVPRTRSTNNENLTSVLIGLLRDGKQVATIQLTNASVSQYDQHGGNVTLQFTYQKIEWTWVDGGITARTTGRRRSARPSERATARGLTRAVAVGRVRDS